MDSRVKHALDYDFGAGNDILKCLIFSRIRESGRSSPWIVFNFIINGPFFIRGSKI
jgi:hypothetical protein